MKLNTMKKIFVFSLLMAGLAFFGCKEPEIVPAPTTRADLKIHFQGIINGSDVEWTKNVDGYKASSFKAFQPNGANLLDLSYNCRMESNTKVSYIQVALGSLLQDPELNTSPSMETFRDFMDNNLLPSYSKKAEAGFEVSFKSEDGFLFRSDETQPATVEFMDLVEKEDNSGEYIQFKCKFSCPIFYIDTLFPINNQSGVIQNATLTGYFTR